MFSDLSELLLDSIILLLHNNDAETKKAIYKLIELVEDEKHAHLFSDPELIKCLSKLVKDLLLQDDSTSKAEQAEVLIRFATNATLAKYPTIQDNLNTIFGNTEDMSTARVRRLFLKIKNNIAWHTCNTFTKKIFGQLNKVSAAADEEQQELILSNIINTAKDMVENEVKNLSCIDRTVVERIDLSDPESIKPAIARFKLAEVANVLKTPLQGFNMMCGKRGGIALGESVSINALPGQYKTGLLLLLGYGITRYNVPSTKLGSGIPMGLFLSFENEANKNMMWWYRQIYAAQFGKYPEGKEDADVAKYVADVFGDCGYRFFIERRLGANFGFDEYCMLIEEYKAIGYRPTYVLIDYMNLMKKTSRLTGTSAKQNHLMLRDLYNNMCNYNRSEAITQISAHQLNRDASNLAHSGKQNIVKLFGENVMADGMDVQREVDLSVFIHLEYNQHDIKFLTVKRDKHRYVDDTPKIHQYFAYPFTEFGIIPDYNQEIGFVRDIYAAPSPETEDNEDTTSKDVF
jgi:hypothetical protein